MRLSKSFLSDYIDLSDISFQDLADKMVLAGNEYESIEKMSNATGLVVGHVLECKKHPESSKLSICMVNYGEDTKQILCGASNVDENQKVIVAKVGAKLPGDIEIKAAKLAGMDSNGMICSLLELGTESKYLSDEDKNGIHVLPNDAVIGTDPLKYLGLDDEVIDFELTSNRADLMNILGMAYEVGAIYNKKVKLSELNIKEEKDDINKTHKLSVKTDNCSLYIAKLITGVEIKESPEFIKNRLIASGIRPINNVVDISNYVMLEYGQPLHFFDADKLGNTVSVRMARDNEEITTLDGAKRILKDTDIVITDGSKPVALAGVMGGLDTEVTNNTKNILIESAIFNPYNIRYTSKRVLRSEASNRFEKGIDPNRSILAIKRASQMLQQHANGIISKGELIFGSTLYEPKVINISLSKINEVLGMQLTSEEVTNIFNRLEFKCEVTNEFKVTVPTRRLDITIKEDLIEEVGRIYSYNNVKGVLPVVSIKRGNYSKKAKLVRDIRRQMNSLGLNQVLTYSLISSNMLPKFVPELHQKITLIDPMSEDKKVMRQSLITSLLSVWEYNTSRNIKDVNIFEIGSTYYKNDTYQEDTTLSGLLYGNYLTNEWQGKKISADFYLVKGVIESLLKYLGLNNRYTFSKENIQKDYHPNKSAAILVDNQVVGYLGQVHPLISKKEIYVFELNLEILLQIKVRGIKFKEISKYPSVNKDLAFVMKKSTQSSDIANIIKKIGGRMLSNLDIFDLYIGENVKEDEKSIAFALTFADPTRTLNDEEVTNVINKIVSEVEKTGAKLRTK
jgi:phenylalanyl-tRNA synthetase beta chain